MASTALTAVFCFLYLTKPVLQESPAMRVDDGGGAGLRNHMIAETGPEETGPEETSPAEEASELRPGLDPGFGMFPDQARAVDPVVAALSQPEPLDLLDVPASPEPESEVSAMEPVAEPAPVMEREEPMPVRVSIARRSDTPAVPAPGGFQPMRVENAGAPLFQSLTKADLARLAERKSARELAAAEDAPVGLESGQDREDDSLLADAPGEEMEDAEDATEETVVAVEDMEMIEEAGDAADEALVTLDDEDAGDAADEALLAVDDKEMIENAGDATSEGLEAISENGPVLRASLIGEFYGDDEGDQDEEQDMLKTAMR